MELKMNSKPTSSDVPACQSKNQEKWMKHYNELKAYVSVHRHFPDKHKVEFRSLLNWAKYTRKKIKAGTLPEEQRLLFEALEASRSDEHTGGRSKTVNI